MTTFHVALIRFVMVLAMSAQGVAFAQSPAQFPQLQLSLGGRINTVAAAPDGGTLLGGQFSTVNGSAHLNIARLSPDGTLDSSWHADADDVVSTIVIGADGTLFVGGLFQNIGGFHRYNLAKLDAFGNVDPSWDPRGSGTGVVALALDNTGYLYVSGGQFAVQVGVGYTNGLAKISATSGNIDPMWDPAGISGTFWVYTLQADNLGSIYAGGYFTNIGGQWLSNLARLSTDGAGAADSTWNPHVDGEVEVLRLDSDGNVFIAGGFSKAGGLWRFGLAKLSASGAAADPNWEPVGSTAFAMVLDGHGSIYIGDGKFSASGVGAADPSWNLGTNGGLRSIAITPAGTLVAGGEFIAFGGVGRVGYGAMSPGGTVLPAANVGDKPGSATAIATQPNGGVIVGGNFDIANGVVRKNIARITPSGEMDPQWNPGRDSAWDFRSERDTVSALAIDANGDVFIGGQFTAIGGRSRLGLAKLAGGGSGLADPEWNPVEPYYPVFAQALAIDNGSLFVGGVFNKIGGQVRSNLAKLAVNGTGTADSAWNPAPDNGVDSLAAAPDHSMYVGGYFTHIGTASRNYIAKLSGIGNGEADPSWNPNADAPVQAIQVGRNGVVYAAGQFGSIGGRSLSHIAKLAGDGAGNADSNWIMPTQPLSGTVNVIAIARNDLYVGGAFSSLQGIACSNLARVDTSTGTIDPEWLPILHNDYSPWSQVYAFARDAGDAVYVGGDFTRIGAVARNGFAKFLQDEIFMNDFDN